MIYSISFIVCDQAGNILRVGSCPEFLVSAQAGQNEMVFEGEAETALHYIDVQTGERRNKARIVPTVSGLVLSGLPIPCTVCVEESTYEITDGEVTLSFDVPGTYSVIVSAEKMIPAVVDVTQP